MAFVPLLIWIALIFFLSSSQGSVSQTSFIIRPILLFLFPDAPEQTIQNYHAYIRKAAHFSEYAVLAFLAARAFGAVLSDRVRNQKYLIAFLAVLAIAGIDELNQSLNILRTGSLQDVILDISGGFTMLLIVWLNSRWNRKKAVRE
ncbi:MAG: VanZ family protein [Acidobacteria bacterium]|nr:VanZ family protein [Acidobacteriota bacterium]